MTELKSISLISSGQFPELTDDVIDEIEDFLLYSVDSEVTNHVYNLVQFFQINLSNFIQEKNLTYASQHYQKRLLRAMRFFRHSSLNLNLSRQLEDIAFTYLRNSNSSYMKQLAYVFLIDHFLTDPNGIPENCQQLILWSIDFINYTLRDIASIDLNLYLTLIYSIPNLFSLSPQTVNIPQFEDILINIAISGLQYLKKAEYSDDHFSIIDKVSKSLKLCYQLITQSKKITNDTATFLLHLESLLSSDEISYSSIFQNYLMVACSIIQIEVPFSSEALSELPKKTIPFLVRYFPYFIQMPLSQSKKISFFLKTVAVWLSRVKSRPLNNLINILPNIWNLVSSFHGRIMSVTVITEIIRNLVSFDLLRDNPSILHSIVENLVASLEIVRLDIDSFDFTKPNRQFETENWLECNKQIITLIYKIIQFDAMLLQKSNVHYSTMRINPIVRFVKYICYLLDLAAAVANQNEIETLLSTAVLHQIHVTEFRDKMTYIFDIFVLTLKALSQPLFNHILSLTMFDLLPKQQQRYFHKRVFAQFLKGPYLLDFENIFFATIADHFDELMLPTPPSILLMIIRIVFKTAFSDDNPIQLEQCGNLCMDVYRFIIQAISSKNATLLELLLTMFHSYFQSKTQKFNSLIKIISSSPFQMNYALRVLSEYPSLKDVVSFLSLFLFPLCNMQQQVSQQQQQQLTEPWIQLFLPSIESQNRISTSIPTLYNYTSRSFAQLIGNLKDPVQTTFVTSLITPLSKTPKEQNLKILLGKIPDIACKLSLQTQAPKKKNNNYVLIGGFQIDIEIVFEGIKRKSSPSEKEMNTLFEGYCLFIASMSFFDAVNDSLVDQMSEFIQKNSPKLIESMYNRYSPPTQYAALFLRQKYSSPIDGIEVDDPDSFLQHIVTLCYSQSTAKEALYIISLHLDNVENQKTIAKVNAALLHAAQFDDKKVFDIISNQIMNREFKDKPDLQNEIIQHFRNASTDIMTPIRRTGIKLVVLAEAKFNINDLMISYRQEVMKNISSIFQNQPLSRFEFIFNKPFVNDHNNDPVENIRKLLEYFEGKTIPIISKEVQILFKKLKWIDIKNVLYINAKFVLKMIANFVLVAENMNWIYIIGILREDTTINLRQFIPYFIKKLKNGAKQMNKTVLNSLPNTISGLVLILRNNIQSTPEDIRIIRFLLEFSPFKIQLDQMYQQFLMQIRYQMKQQNNMQAKQMQQQMFQQMQQEIIQFIQIITNIILSLQHSLTEMSRNFLNQKGVIQDTFKQIAKLIKELKPIIQKGEVDISMLLQAYIDICLFCKINLISIDTHFHYVFDSCPSEIIKVLLLKFHKMWSFDLFFVILDILEHPKVPQFRNTLFEHLIKNFKNVFAYIMKNAARDIEIVLSRSLNTLCNIVNNLEFNEFDLLQVIHLTKKILNKLKKKAVHFMKKSGEQPILPSLFVKYTQIMLPLRFTNEICSNPKLFNYYKTKVMTAFITRPSIQLFQHPLFNRRLVDFMKLLDDQHRNELYSLVPSPSESKCILINQILCDRYRYFPEEVQIKSDFANFVKTPSFPVLILNFSAALLASNKCVNLVDLKDTPILTTNRFTHALAIHSKLRSIESIKTLSRFFSIIKILTNIDSLELDGMKTALTERLDTTPYSIATSLLLFRTLGQPSCIIDHTSRAITQYIMGFSTTMLKQTAKIVDPQFIFLMPHVFQALLCMKPTCQRLFEILLATVVMVLRKMPDKTSMGQLIPTTMSQLVPFIDSKLVDSNLIRSLKEILMENPSNDEPTNQTRAKFLLQLIPVVARFLFENHRKKENVNKAQNQFEAMGFNDFDTSSFTSFNPSITINIHDNLIPNFFPYILLPNIFFTKSYTKSIYTIYQKALRESVIAGSGNVSLRIIKEMYEYLRKIINKSISPPNLLSAFSTIATWIDEVTTPEWIENLKLLLEALKPVSPEQLFVDLSCLKQPMNQTVSHFIIKMLETDFPDLIDLTPVINSMKPLTLPRSIDLNSDCWKIDWFSINVESHISVFMRLISPSELQSIIPFFTSTEMKSIISIILNSTPLPVTFPRFMKYYVVHFPRSSLSECFCTTMSFLSLMPYPTLSLFTNIEFLETINIPEDALGLLKSESKSFLNSASFLQLSQFRAAKYFFLKTMNDDPSHYFFALPELRSVDINLSLHRCGLLRKQILGFRKENTFPMITLPFYPESSDSGPNQKEFGNRLTSFISKSHIPFLFRSSLEDEVYQYIKVMQQPDSLKTYKLEELTRISSTAWLKGLDKNMMMTSNFVWRLTILNDFLTNNELAQETMIIKQIQELIDTNRNLISNMLSHSGATRDSLDYFSKSPEKKCVFVSLQNYSRVSQYLEGLYRNNRVKNDKALLIPITMPQSSGISSSRSDLSILNEVSLEKLKNRCNFLMRDFGRMKLKGRKWLDALFYMFCHHPNCIDMQSSFNQILQDLNNSTIYESQSHISMLLYVIKNNQPLIFNLMQEFTKLKPDIRLSFLRWLPQIICCSNELPDDLIHNLIRSNPVIFCITYEDYFYSTILRYITCTNDFRDKELLINLNLNMKKIKMMIEPGSIYMRANKMNKEFQAINEYRNGMSWVQNCMKEIEQLHFTVRAHKFLYEYLAKLEAPPEILNNLGFSSVKELILFCEKNPPVFRTNLKTTNYSSFNGFKFPFSKAILSVFIESDSESTFNGESTLRYVTVKGESKMLQIVSPEIYGMSQRERLFIEFMSQLIEKNVSSHTRSKCTYYPFSFLVHEYLMVIDSHQFTSLHSSIQPISAVKQIVEGALIETDEVTVNDREKSDTPSDVNDSIFKEPPFDITLRKKSNIPPHSLLWWFLQGANGSKTDFIFMRQSFASYFGAASLLHLITMNQLPLLPSLMLVKDRLKCCMPGFLGMTPPQPRFIAQTKLISCLLPEFVMKGSFAASWQIAADSLAMYKERIKIVLKALIMKPDLPMEQLIQDYASRQQQMNQMSREQTENLKISVIRNLKLFQQHSKIVIKKASCILRIDKISAIHMTEETEKCDDVFPFMLMEHLINNSANALSAQPIAFSWI